MSNLKSMSLGILAIALVLSSCKKEKVVGPTGPAGAAGNANVKSMSFQTTAVDWTGDGVSGYYINLTTPIITADIVATGAVMCYMESAGQTYALPYSYLYGGFTRHMNFTFAEGSLVVNIKDDDGATSNPGGFNAKIKVVAISSTGMKQHPDLNLTDYEAVKKAFDL